MTAKELISLVILLLKYIRYYDMSHRKRNVIHEIAHDALRNSTTLMEITGISFAVDRDVDVTEIPF